MTELKHTFKTDILFKLLFTKHPKLLKHLVAQLLRIPLESIEYFQIENPEMTPQLVDRKFCRLDIRMTVNGQHVNLEVQVENEGDYPERALFHWARIYSNALLKGKDYSELPRTIVISILAFTLFKDCKEFYSEFQALEVTRNTRLTDKMALYFFELTKLPEPEHIHKDDLLLLWLALFKADTVEEMKRIKETGVPEMSEAVNAYNNVTTSAEFEEIERMLIKASHDEAQALRHARLQESKKWQKKIAKKDAAIADKDAEIEELRKKLAEAQSG